MCDINKELLEILEKLSKSLTNKDDQELLTRAKTIANRQNISIQVLELQASSFENCGIMFEDHVRWESRKEYFESIKNFLNNKIDGDTFCSQIISLRNQNFVKMDEVEANLTSKTDFHLTSKSIGFSNLIETLFYWIELFDSDVPDSESSCFGISEIFLKLIIQDEFLPQFSKYS